MQEFNISDFNRKIDIKSTEENLLQDENILNISLNQKYSCWAKIDIEKFLNLKNGKKINEERYKIIIRNNFLIKIEISDVIIYQEKKLKIQNITYSNKYITIIANIYE